MKTLNIALAGIALPLIAAAQGDPFPAFEQLEKSTVMPGNATLSVAPDGHFLVNGVPRYLPITIYYEGTVSSLSRHTAGYPAVLNWLYEDTLDYEGHQRLGFDATGLAAGNGWIRKYRRKQWFFNNDGGEKSKKIAQSGLPVYLDYTCSPWNQGNIRYQEGQLPAKAAFTVPGHGNYHWMPYSATTPEGRQLYTEMWKFGVEYAKRLGAKPFVYELFNEPDYNDWSPFNRKLFVERMRKKFGKIEKLNQAWHSRYPDFERLGDFKNTNENPAFAVEWIKFMEDCFIDICRLGVQTIREADPRPEVLICVQPLVGKFTNTNFYQYNRMMNAICTPTGGGTAVRAREYIAVADGKPIFDGETYFGNTRQSIRNKLWLQYARGLNGSTAFKWCRRPYDQLWKKADEQGGRKVAEKFPYLMLNPYAVPPEALTGIRQAKEEIQKLNHLFTPRKRGIRADISLLYSQPTRRLARAVGSTDYNLYTLYGNALGSAPLAYHVIFEEQLADRNPGKILIAAGTATVAPETRKNIERYVRNGGTLLLIQDAMQCDEYGFDLPDNTFPGLKPGRELKQTPEPFTFGKRQVSATAAREIVPGSGWECIGRLNGAPAVFRRVFGKGEVLYFNLKMPGEAVSEILLELAGRKGIRPLCRLLEESTGKEAYDMEVQKAVLHGESGYVITNCALGGQLVRFIPAEKDGILIRPLTGEKLEPGKNGYLLYLPKQEPLVLVYGKEKELTARYGTLTPVSKERAEKEANARFGEEIRKRQKAVKAFHVDPARLKTIDLRDQANRAYVDRVSGDGKGGWTDQGENSLHNVPWNVVECNGILFDFIRPDMNDNRACIVLGSKSLPSAPREVTGIKVDSKAAKLYFLHATAWTREGVHGMSYIVRYADGSSQEIPIRDCIETADWFRLDHAHPNQKAVPGWKNQEQKGLWIYAWTNPHPEKTIAAIDAVSQWKETIPLIGAITLERPADKEKAALNPFTVSPANFRMNAWSGVNGSIKPSGEIQIRQTEKAKDWSGVNLMLKQPIDIPSDYAKGFLEFEVNGLCDSWGKAQGNQAFQVRLRGTTSEGKESLGSSIHAQQYSGGIDKDPKTFQTVRIPMERLWPKGMVKLRGIQVQFQLLPPERSGIEIRKIRLILP